MNEFHKATLVAVVVWLIVTVGGMYLILADRDLNLCKKYPDTEGCPVITINGAAL